MTMQILTAKRDRDEQGWPMWKIYSDEVGYVGEVCADTEGEAIETAWIEGLVA